MIDISTPTGSSLSRTDAVLREVETVLDAQPEVKHQLSNLGHGNPRVYYNVFPREDASNYAEVFVQLKAYDAQRTPLFLDRLRASFNAIPGAEIIVKEFETGPPNEPPIGPRMIDTGFDTLRQQTRNQPVR